MSCIGTGGTISGAGRYLKEVSGGAVRVIGADPASSVYAGGDGRPYFIEAAGHFVHPDTAHDIWPTSYHPDVVDTVLPVADREALDRLRQLARTQGLLVGGSSGTALAAAHRVAAGAGAEAVVVVILPDSGRQYLSKYFNDTWMLGLGFLDGDASAARVADAVTEDARSAPLPYLNTRTTVGEALAVLRARARDGAEPVLPAGPCPAGPDRRPMAPELTGSVTLAALESALQGSTATPADPLADHLEPPLLTFGYGEPAEEAADRLAAHPHDTAVVLRDGCAQALITPSVLRAAVPTPR